MFGIGKSAQERAEGILAERSRIIEALQKVESQLPPLIQKRLDAEHEIAEAEAAEELGEKSNTAAAKRRLSDVLASIANLKPKMDGLRTRIVAQAESLATAHAALRAALPEHYAKIETDFRAEWADAVASWSAMLGRRRALETVLGKHLDLQEPSSTSVVDLEGLQEEIVKPARVLAALTAAIDDVAGLWRWRMPPRVNPGDPIYDPTAVYRLTRPYKDGFRELMADTLVIGMTFEDGCLAQLVQVQYAEKATDPKQDDALRGAEMSAREIARQRADDSIANVAPRMEPLVSPSPVTTCELPKDSDEPETISRPITEERLRQADMDLETEIAKPWQQLQAEERERIRQRGGS